MDTNLSSGVTLHCTECGKVFSVEDLIRHGNAYVCAACKPAFIQKLAEGADIRSSKLNFAGFWIRFGAAFLDGIIMFAINYTLGRLLVAALTPSLRAQLIVIFFQLGLGIFYEVYFIGKFGATLGKMALHLKVVTADGGAVSYLRAGGRYFAKLLNIFTLSIGYIIAAFDDEKRGLHDRICGTRVVRV